MENMENNTILSEEKEPAVEEVIVEEAVTEEPVTPAPKKANVLAIISLVCGILSIVLSCCCGWATLLFGPASVILGAVSPKNENGKKNGMAIAGIILGIVSVVLFIGSLLLSLLFPALGAMLSEISSPTTYY